MRLNSLTFLISILVGSAAIGCGDSGDETGTDCVESHDVPFCDDESLPIVGDGCVDPCEGEGAECASGTCTEAWIGCGPTADCDVCGTSDWVCI